MIPLQQIHPILVHFPIVFVIVLAVFDTVATAMRISVTGRTASGNVSTALAVLAAGAAAAAYVAGGMALDIAEAGGFSSPIAELHDTLGGVVAGSLAVWAVVRAWLWWRDRPLTGPIAALVPMVAFAGAALVVMTAWYGGQLVFDLGVNVIRRSSSMLQMPSVPSPDRDHRNPFWPEQHVQGTRDEHIVRNHPAAARG